MQAALPGERGMQELLPCRTAMPRSSRAPNGRPSSTLTEMTAQKTCWWNGLWPFLIPAVYFLMGLWGYYVSSPG